MNSTAVDLYCPINSSVYSNVITNDIYLINLDSPCYNLTFTEVCRRLQAYLRVHRGLQGYTRVDQGIHGVYRGLQRYTGVYKGMQGYTRFTRSALLWDIWITNGWGTKRWPIMKKLKA